MPNYTTAQRGGITSFVNFTEAKESIAAKFLKNNNWNVEQAVDAYYSSGTTTVPAVEILLNKLFDQYRDQPKESPDKIGIEGAQKYLNDLGVQLDEVVHLALCELLKCPSIGEFERVSFITGWRSLSAHTTSPQPITSYDTITKQSAYISSLRKRITADTEYFRQVYRYTFNLARLEGQKSVPADSAIEFWTTCFSKDHGGVQWNNKHVAWLDLWLEFCTTHVKRPVNKDLWNMVGELVVKTTEPGGDTLTWWTEDGAWPMAIDEFVAHIKKKGAGSADKMDTS